MDKIVPAENQKNQQDLDTHYNFDYFLPGLFTRNDPRRSWQKNE